MRSDNRPHNGANINCITEKIAINAPISQPLLAMPFAAGSNTVAFSLNTSVQPPPS